MRKVVVTLSCGLALVSYVCVAQAQEVSTSDRNGSASPEPATLLSFRVSPGLGGGGSGTLAARIGGEIDYWLTQHVGVGALVAATALIERAEEARSYVLVGPVLALRSKSRGSHALLSGTLGWMRWSCAPGPCDDDGERAVSGVGGALEAGYIARAGLLEVGPSVALNFARGHVGSDEPSITFTLNLELGFALSESTMRARSSR